MKNINEFKIAYVGMFLIFISFFTQKNDDLTLILLGPGCVLMLLFGFIYLFKYKGKLKKND